MKLAVIGAGLSGATIANRLATAGHDVEVYDSRDHLAGNCHTYRHQTGVLVHAYGPHIFHTDNANVWTFVNHFATFRQYEHRVKATAGGSVFQLPINLLTISQAYGKALSPREAKSLLPELQNPPLEAESFEQAGRRMLGDLLYERFFHGYTTKQWGRSPSDLPGTILARLPVRFNFEDNYFNHPFQGIPTGGYTEMVARMLDVPRITVHLSTEFKADWSSFFQHIFTSSPLDQWFDNRYGRLEYRTLDFEEEIHDGDYQGCAQMNFCDSEVPWTRVTEFKHFEPEMEFQKTVIFREFSRNCEENDTPYYPVRLQSNAEALDLYLAHASGERGVTFVGRLGTYRYLDMDKTIQEALVAAEQFLRGDVRWSYVST